MSDGIFGDSKVLMTHFDRNEIIGVIINKEITIRGGEVIKVLNI
jgi:hypothetical protein